AAAPRDHDSQDPRHQPHDEDRLPKPRTAGDPRRPRVPLARPIMTTAPSADHDCASLGRSCTAPPSADHDPQVMIEPKCPLSDHDHGDLGRRPRVLGRDPFTALNVKKVPLHAGGQPCGNGDLAGEASSSRWSRMKWRFRSARWSKRCGTFEPGVSDCSAVAGSSRAETQPSWEAARATTSAIGVTIIELPKYGTPVGSTPVALAPTTKTWLS